MSIPRAITGVSKEDTNFSRLSQPPPALTVPSDGPSASSAALKFIQKISSADIKYTLFTDNLVTFTDLEAEMGSYKASAKLCCYKGEDCVLVEARSEGNIDGALCYTEVTAYVKFSLETLYQDLHEMVELEQGTLDRRTLVTLTSEGYHVHKEVKQGDKKEVLDRSLEVSMMEGYISEGANIVLQRIMITKPIPDYFDVLSFDSDTNICLATYKDLAETEIQVGHVDVVKVRCYGIERRLHCLTDVPVTWHTYMLSDGHLISRAQVGSPILMKVALLPALLEHDEQLPIKEFPPKSLDWRNDLQLSSIFLDRKEALEGSYRLYLRSHPEIQSLIADFLQALLAQKPEDTLTFAKGFFCTFSNRFQLDLPSQVHSKKENVILAGHSL